MSEQIIIIENEIRKQLHEVENKFEKRIRESEEQIEKRFYKIDGKYNALIIDFVKQNARSEEREKAFLNELEKINVNIEKIISENKTLGEKNGKLETKLAVNDEKTKSNTTSRITFTNKMLAFISAIVLVAWQMFLNTVKGDG